MAYIILQQASDIKRGKDSGIPWTWKSGKEIKRFTHGDVFGAFCRYVDENVRDLKDAVAFTGSASLITQANGYLTMKLREAGLL